MDDDYDDDGSAGFGGALFGDDPQEEGLFPNEEPTFVQDGPGLFDDFEEEPAAPEDDSTSPAPNDKPVEVSEPATVEPEADSVEAPHGEAQTSADEPDGGAEIPVEVPDVDDAGALPDADVPAEDREVVSAAAPLALYRRYRPDSFVDVIGQDHVTVPLRRALENNRVNHAYLFSGPRGCGKTTSARILARCLNCEQGPTPVPCGRCRSCVDLARGGPGSIDVIEIDAASHGGVDDARDLRERAYFAPVHSRYKIYIVDEAHMVTTQGFNALLKLVEEPPPHAKFIFATTEPDKVIGTIRSRTHHYPFRLVPPRLLTEYLMQICEAEGVAVDGNALPLVVRAGGGSVRDSLSILDQLLGGAAEDGVSYEQAAALLGYTPDALLDEIMDAFAAGDSAGVFQSIDKVIEVGQDPRRFAEDLLRRLRDLVILDAVPEAATNGMLDVADDQAQRLATQVAGMGSGELTRAAEVIATGLTQMRGTTAPRLHLELMCARVLLPGADVDERGIHARMDRLERRVGMMGDAPAPKEWDDPPARSAQPEPVSQAAPPADAKPQQVPDPAPEPQQRPSSPPSQQRPAGAPPQQAGAAQQRPAGAAPQQRPAGAPPQQRPAGAPPEQSAAPTPPEASAAEQTPRGQLTAAELRRAWPGVLDAVKSRRRFSHMLLSQNAQVHDVADGRLVLGFSNPGARENFLSSGTQELLLESLIQVIGVDLQIEAIVTASNDPGTSQRRAPEPTPPPQPEPRQNRPARPEPSAEASAAPEREAEPEIADDDSELKDASQAAADLLVAELGATVIETTDDTDGPH